MRDRRDVSNDGEDFTDLETDPVLAAMRERLEAGTTPGEELTLTPDDAAALEAVWDELNRQWSAEDTAPAAAPPAAAPPAE